MKVQLKSTDGTENLYPVTSANSVIFPDGNNLEAKFPELVGKSAYQSWLDAGHTGTEAEFVESLQGKDGKDGKDGEQGNSGFTPGEGAIELVNNLYQGGETSFLSAEQGKILNDKLYYPCEGNTLATALLEVDANYRTPGRVIRFQDETGKYRNYRYMGKYYTELDWTTETSWLDIDNADKFKVWYFLESPDLSNYTLGAFNSSGALVSGNYKITDFLEIPEGGLPIGGSWYRRYVLYDTDKETIKSTALLYGGKTFNQTQGAYVRLEFENYNLNWNYGYTKGTSGTPGKQHPHVRVFPDWDMVFDFNSSVDWTYSGGGWYQTTGLIPVYKGEVISKLSMLADTANTLSNSWTLQYKKYNSEKEEIDGAWASTVTGTFTVDWEGYIQFRGVNQLCFHVDGNTNATIVAIVRGIERPYKNVPKWLILGDSISAHSSSLASQGYGWLIGSEHNICVVNRAVGGHASASTINVVNGIDFSPYDVCTIAIGTNDLNYNILASAFETNLHTIIDTIQAAKPTIKIGIFNLFRRAQYPTDETKNSGSNATFGQYEDTIKKVANEYGIPMLDVEHECQANFRIATYAENYSTNGDGLHPNNDAHKLFVYPLVKQFLEKLLG